jgi:hypothetical protein
MVAARVFDHSLDCFFSLACPLVSLTLSSLALWTMAFLNADAHHTISRDLPGLGGHSRCDFTGEHSVVHQQQLEVLGVAEEKLLESICQSVASLFSRAIANGGEGLVASELSTDSAINTVGSSPRSLLSCTLD